MFFGYMIRYLIIFIRVRTRASAIYYLKIRDTMKNSKKTLGTPIDGSLPLEVKNLFKKYGKEQNGGYEILNEKRVDVVSICQHFFVACLGHSAKSEFYKPKIKHVL